MAKRLFINYGSLRQDTHDTPTGLYDPATFNFGYELEIHDRDFTGTALPMSEISSDGAVISQKGGSDMNKVIVPSVLDFTMYVNSAGEEAFIADLIDGDEERFTVRLYHREQLLFVGYILIEQVSQDIKGSYRSLNITATDGISRLKEVKYPTELGGENAFANFNIDNESGSDVTLSVDVEYYNFGLFESRTISIFAPYDNGDLQVHSELIDSGDVTNVTFTFSPPANVTIVQAGAIVYNNVVSRIGYPTFMETIVRCLNESNINSLYSDTHPLINVYTNWEESEMDFTNATRRGLLDQISCQSNLFLNVNKSTNEEGVVSVTKGSTSKDCHKVLETILTTLHCKMFYENGRYYIRHAFGSEAANREMLYKSYSSSGEYISEAIMDKSKDLGYKFEDDLRLISPSSTKYIAPYKYCEVELTAQGDAIGLSNNILKAPDVGDPNNSNYEGWNWRTYNYSLIGEEISMKIDFYHYAKELDVWKCYGDWNFQFQVRVGDYYLQVNEGEESGIWIANDTTVCDYTYTPPSIIVGDRKFTDSELAIDCAPLPVEGNLEIRIVKVSNTGNAFVPSPYILYQRANKDLSFIDAATYPDVNPPTTITGSDWEVQHYMQIVSATNNDDHNGKFTYRSTKVAGNSRVKNVKIILGELDDVVDSISQVYTWNESEGKMSPYKDTSGDITIDVNPVRDWGGEKTLIGKLMDSYSTTHSKPKEILVGSIDDTKNSIDYNTVIEWMGNDYMPISLRRITSKDRYVGEWIEIGKTAVDNSGDNVDIFYVPTRNGFLGTNATGAPSQTDLDGLLDESGGSSGGALLFSRTYEITDQDYAEILTYTIPDDMSIYKRRSIDDSFVMYVNGVRQIYEIDEADVNRAGRFTLEEGTTNWKLFRNVTSQIRLEVYDRLIVDTDTNS